MTEEALPAKPSNARRVLIAGIPLLVIAAMFTGFGYQLLSGNDPSLVPSALIDDPVPTVELPPLKAEKPGFGPNDFGGEPILVNVFASWCVPCRVEHPLITALAERYDITVYGLNSKDQRDAAIRWLEELGDPYDKIGYDPTGRAGIEWGVYGYPETFIISPDGRVVFKHVGPISPRLIDNEILPRIAAFRDE
jgi:cytochrome c biogenesis protein CcmG/thiol:disulfide interchange protein DsbE